MTNCPNCGAPITGLECEYCGTVFPNIDICKLDEYLNRGLMTMNEAREMMGLPRLYEDAIAAMRKYTEEY